MIICYLRILNILTDEMKKLPGMLAVLGHKIDFNKGKLIQIQK